MNYSLQSKTQAAVACARLPEKSLAWRAIRGRMVSWKLLLVMDQLVNWPTVLFSQFFDLALQFQSRLFALREDLCAVSEPYGGLHAAPAQQLDQVWKHCHIAPIADVAGRVTIAGGQIIGDAGCRRRCRRIHRCFKK